MNLKIKGKFQKLIYSSNNFFVYSFKLFSNQQDAKNYLEIDENSKNINIISSNNKIDITLDYEVEINKQVRSNSKYKISYYLVNKEVLIPTENDSVVKFLSSSLFKGISTKTAQKLVDNIDSNFLNEIDKYSDQIIDLIGDKKFEIIKVALQTNSIYNEIYKIFIKENLSIFILNYINDKTHYHLKDFLEKNIFDLVDLDENNEFNFFDINKIAKYFYKDYNEDIANEYLILWTILSIEFQGSTINTLDKIYNQLIQYKFLEISEYKKHLVSLIDKEKIISFDKREVSSLKNYNKEKYICKRIKELINSSISYKFNLNDLIFDQADDIQKQAILNSLNNPISIITGGPGTGKTLLIYLILKNLESAGFDDVELLAPTGKAATQISYRTTKGAKTFHSFLKWNGNIFENNEKNPLDTEIIIIDEFSMVNISLFYYLLKACPKLKQIIIVGDKDQLPSIGPGYLLNDFISSQKIITNTLINIYRQNKGSLIAKNSIEIIQGNLPSFDENESILINLDNQEEAINNLLLNIEKINNKVENINDWQILIPMYEGKLGINNINTFVQNLINKNKEFLFIINNQRYFRGDKVIQLENDNNKEVFNGEIGIIQSVKFSENDIDEIIVKFDQKIISYSKSEFTKSVTLAYAISIHKFQGSECNNVFLIFSYEHSSMFSRKLFYTAYTRAREKIIIYSNKQLINQCISLNKDSNRKGNIIKLLN